MLDHCVVLHILRIILLVFLPVIGHLLHYHPLLGLKVLYLS